MGIIIDGKKVSRDIEEELSKEVKAYTDLGSRPPHLAAILVGHDGPSHTYVRNKIRACEAVGYKSSLIKFDNDVSEEKIIFVNLISTPKGIETFQKCAPGTKIITGFIDPELDSRAYIIPGLGDFGDLYFGTQF